MRIGKGNYSINIVNFNAIIGNGKTRNFIGASVDGVLFC
jgi:hypothetical protein